MSESIRPVPFADVENISSFIDRFTLWIKFPGILLSAFALYAEKAATYFLYQDDFEYNFNPSLRKHL